MWYEQSVIQRLAVLRCAVRRRCHSLIIFTIEVREWLVVASGTHTQGTLIFWMSSNWSACAAPESARAIEASNDDVFIIVIICCVCSTNQSNRNNLRRDQTIGRSRVRCESVAILSSTSIKKRSQRSLYIPKLITLKCSR